MTIAFGMTIHSTPIWNSASHIGAAPSPVGASAPFALGHVITFLLLTLGPSKIIDPFVTMTRGRDAAFKRELAVRGTLVGALGLLIAGTTGAKTLLKWGVSLGTLQLTGGIVLFLVALKHVLAEYGTRETTSKAASADTPGTPATASKLAISPLAFPTIVTPWGVAVVIALLTLHGDHVLEIVAVIASILVLDCNARACTTRRAHGHCPSTRASSRRVPS